MAGTCGAGFRMKVPEKYRVTTGIMKSDASYGNNGFFIIPERGGLKVIASDGEGWDHVSVSRLYTTDLPEWDDMCFIKNLFWHPEETVVQFHPKQSEYRGIAQVLHLWKKQGYEYELPPGIMVAPI